MSLSCVIHKEITPFCMICFVYISVRGEIFELYYSLFCQHRQASPCEEKASHIYFKFNYISLHITPCAIHLATVSLRNTCKTLYIKLYMKDFFKWKLRVQKILNCMVEHALISFQGKWTVSAISFVKISITDKIIIKSLSFKFYRYYMYHRKAA